MGSTVGQNQYVDLTGQITLPQDKNKNAPPIAEGGYSDLFKGSWNDKSASPKMVAVKILRVVPDPSVNDTREEKEIVATRILREARVWSGLTHKNILTFYGVCHNLDPGERSALISPWCEAGNVQEYLYYHPDANTFEITFGVASGLQYLHTKDVVHGDLKPHNVLINHDGVPVLCDFGRARLVGQKGFTTLNNGNTPKYTAPEILTFEPVDPPAESTTPTETAYTNASDVYAFGMTVLPIWTGLEPFHPLVNTNHIVIRIGNKERPKQKEYTRIPNLLWSLCEDCWAADRVSRPTMDVVVDRLGAPGMRAEKPAPQS